MHLHWQYSNNVSESLGKNLHPKGRILNTGISITCKDIILCWDNFFDGSVIKQFAFFLTLKIIYYVSITLDCTVNAEMGQIFFQ